jgi:hypothetical protein
VRTGRVGFVGVCILASGCAPAAAPGLGVDAIGVPEGKVRVSGGAATAIPTRPGEAPVPMAGGQVQIGASDRIGISLATGLNLTANPAWLTRTLLRGRLTQDDSRVQVAGLLGFNALNARWGGSILDPGSSQVSTVFGLVFGAVVTMDAHPEWRLSGGLQQAVYVDFQPLLITSRLHRRPPGRVGLFVEPTVQVGPWEEAPYAIPAVVGGITIDLGKAEDLPFR